MLYCIFFTTYRDFTVQRASLFIVNAGAQQTVSPSIRAEIRTRDLQFYAATNLRSLYASPQKT
jgi:hypothetical protein